MASLLELLQRGADALAPQTASSGMLSGDRQAYLDYTEKVTTNGGKALDYTGWVKAGKPTGSAQDTPATQ